MGDLTIWIEVVLGEREGLAADRDGGGTMIKVSGEIDLRHGKDVAAAGLLKLAGRG